MGVAAFVAIRALMPAPIPAVVSIVTGDVTYLSNPGVFGDAIRHEGRFEVGSDGCLYVLVDGDNSSGKPNRFLAAVGSRTRVSTTVVERDDIRYYIGQPAFFEKSELVGQVPQEALERCRAATSVYPLELAR